MAQAVENDTKKPSQQNELGRLLPVVLVGGACVSIVAPWAFLVIAAGLAAYFAFTRRTNLQQQAKKISASSLLPSQPFDHPSEIPESSPRDKSTTAVTSDNNPPVASQPSQQRPADEPDTTGAANAGPPECLPQVQTTHTEAPRQEVGELPADFLSDKSMQQGAACDVSKPAPTLPAASREPSKADALSSTAVATTDAPSAVSATPFMTPAVTPAAGGAGILSRLKAQRAQAAAKKATANQAPPEVVVLYASQTGTAQEVAKSVHASSSEHGIKSKVMSCNELGWENLSAARTPVIVIIASSTGDGDAPDNAAKFYATMKRKTQEKGQLAGISITVLGLGDSNYTRFCHVPKTFRKRMVDLGASHFHESLDADEVDGLEEAIDGWVDGLWLALKQHKSLQDPSSQDVDGASAKATSTTAATAQGEALQGVPPLAASRVELRWEANAAARAAVLTAERAGPSAASLALRDASGQYSPEEPFWASVESTSVLTAADSDRRVIHVALDISDSCMDYHPGDSVGIVVQNEESMVTDLLQRLEADGNSVFSVEAADGSGGEGRLLQHLHWPCTLRTAFLKGCDITGVPRKSLLRLLGEHCSDDNEKQSLLLLSSRSGRDHYNQQIRDGMPSLLDLLKKFPSCHPPLGALLDALPALAPRLYSVASSPLAQPHKVDLVFSMVHMETPYGTKRGVATSYLDGLAAPLTSASSDGGRAPQVRLPIYLRSGGGFHPPADLSKPVVYVGPGTGVAPFRGFLQQRQQQLRNYDGTPGAAWLFFGCRAPKEDALFSEEWESFRADGTLQHLHIAYSRTQAEKVYVQHRMAQNGADLFRILSDTSDCGGGSIFICGDGAHMVQAVHKTLLDIFMQHGNLTEAEATQQLANMAASHRYVKDVWS